MTPNGESHPVNMNKLEQLASDFPTGDFASEHYDNNPVKTTQVKQLLVILSTQRSGSTYLCDLLRQENICNAHEYFQPYQYLQYLAFRWQCIEDGFINKSKYVAQLIKHRVSDKGILGINLHGSHLDEFEAFKGNFDDSVDVRYVFLKRNDEIAQAVSYDIADQTGKWSSFFSSLNKPKYNFWLILEKLERIKAQNALILAFLNKSKSKYTLLTYEELVSNNDIVINDLVIPIAKDDSKTIKKQSTNINDEWIKRFSEDYYNYSFNKKILPDTMLDRVAKRILYR
ncbi:Stf0 family sulfotransferase [Paraglaciecola mesophila]|jgi:LPS sulfotransferase NodH|uniref:Stf0 family sulfotransferase n=1 Tax=Paraglaciecola mesophila TaxID=197222 RepID=A0ABU9SXE4_9ALTE